jgi:putative spermidine/putrescine transport system substrate-binding protein
MNRRSFLAAGAATGLVLAARPAFAATRLDMYTNSDANISDFWTNVIRPAFEAANPDVKINVVIARTSGGIEAVTERAIAALGGKFDPQFDYAESFNPLNVKAAMEANLWTDWSTAGLANYGLLNPLGFETNFGLSYRGSQVLLAYDTTKLAPADAPRTWADLVTWIKANPGQFVYNRPDKGGSGGNFVRRAIHEANGRDPKAFTFDNFSDAYAAETLAKGWDILRDIAPALYEGGSYTAGNSASIQLLSQGVVTMAPVWSDQVIQAISKGVLPETTGLVQLSDLAFSGGFSQTVVPVNAANHALALKLADFVLSPEIQTKIVTDVGGFPGIDWKHLPAELQEKYADVVPASIPTFPGGPWSAAISDGWYREVAPNVARD